MGLLSRTMAKKFSELRAKMSPERRARNDAVVKAELAEMPLNELSKNTYLRYINFSDHHVNPQPAAVPVIQLLGIVLERARQA